MPETVQEPTQDRTVVLAVVIFLGLMATGGLAGLVFLIWTGADATSLLAVSNPTMGALGGLGGLLALTRTGNQAAEQKGAEKALAQVQQLKDAEPASAPIPSGVPIEDVGAG